MHKSNHKYFFYIFILYVKIYSGDSMKLFLIIYIVVLAIFSIAEFFLSNLIEKKPLCKTFSMINVLLCIAFIVISMGIFERRFNLSMLKSSIIGAFSLALIYLADIFGSKFNKNN